MKKLSLVLACSLFFLGYALAQRTITGTVSDVGGEPLIGASVLVKGTTVGTVTEVDGSYTINVPSGNTTLVVSYTGFETQEVEIGASDVVDVTLSEGLELQEVVVTGLGIKKEKKALGYGVSTLSNKEVASRPEADVARILRGKATGVDIVQTSGLSGSGTNILIRGYSSITGDNQPLFVVDGVPFNTGNNSNRSFTSGSATASSRFLDLDPNDVEEISILKGLSATVLYGEAGRNGVILVTTKNGNAGANANKKMEVTVNQTISRSEVANLPDYQNSFGNGFSGNFGWFFSNWGAAFSDTNPGSYGPDYKGVSPDGYVYITHPYDQSQFAKDFPEYTNYPSYEYRPYTGIEDFFQPGVTSNTSLSIAKNVGNGTSFSATYSYLSDEGFTPRLDAQRDGGASNFINKHNFGLGAQTKLTNGLTVKGTFNFASTDRRTPITGPAFGGDGNGLFAALLFTPRSIDLMNLPYQSPLDGRNVYYRRGGQIQNPRWVLNNSADFEKIQRFFSTTELNYELSPSFNLMYRFGLDTYTQQNERQTNRGGVSTASGLYQTDNFQNSIFDHVLNLTFTHSLSEDLSLDVIAGTNLRRNTYARESLLSTNQFIFNLFNHSNFTSHTSDVFGNGSGDYRDFENTIGVYATATLGFKNFLYLNLQGRNDWTSTLEPENNSLFYPSASLSFVVSDAIPSLQNNAILNYLKLRVGYGTSAGYPDPYQTRNTLASQASAFITGGGATLNTNSVDDRLGNKNLKPELHKELEGGIEARLLRDRIGVDLSLYNKNSNDLIIDLSLDPATGYTRTTVNAAGLTNKGVELGLNITPVRGKVTWDMTLNYTKNVSEVTELYPGVERIQIAGYSTLGNYAIVGQPYGVLYGSPFVKDASGNLVVNNVGTYQSSADNGIIGDPNPAFQANWINNVSWKGLSFGFQWQYIDKGDIYSSTVQALLARGNTSDTDVDRYIPLIMPGVKSDGSPNDIQTYIGDSFFDAYFGANEGGVFDGTTIRLREVSLSYVLPQSLLAKTPFGRIGLTLTGENLWYNAPNFPVGINFDPEVSSLGVGNGRGFDFRTAPTVKKYGISLNATF
ncbi:MAG: SusC/RagA family TonB-linked outer membrane protein [Lewinellaceae bacterium]|nr:SusC/RagA family TonB-linked outer membrane protein [Lewinellaceae bacterium]